jgi:hypothetical protein
MRVEPAWWGPEGLTTPGAPGQRAVPPRGGNRGLAGSPVTGPLVARRPHKSAPHFSATMTATVIESSGRVVKTPGGPPGSSSRPDDSTTVARSPALSIWVPPPPSERASVPRPVLRGPGFFSNLGRGAGSIPGIVYGARSVVVAAEKTWFDSIGWSPLPFFKNV